MLNFSQVMFSEIDVRNEIAVGSYNCLHVTFTKQLPMRSLWIKVFT